MVKNIILIFLSFLLSANCEIAPKITFQEPFAISANDLNNIDFSSPETITDDIYKTLVLFVGDNASTFDRIIFEKNVKTILEKNIQIEKSPDVQDFSSNGSKLKFLNEVSSFYGVSFELIYLRLQ